MYLNEQDQTSTIDSLVNEIVTTCSLHAPAINEELVVLDNLKQSSSSHQTSQRGGEPVRKKCMLEKLLCTTSLERAHSSVIVTHNELVMAELSHYKSEPALELNGRPLEWWNKHKHSFSNLSRMTHKYLRMVAASIPSERLFRCAGNVVTSKRSTLKPEHDNLPSLKDHLLY